MRNSSKKRPKFDKKGILSGQRDSRQRSCIRRRRLIISLALLSYSQIEDGNRTFKMGIEAATAPMIVEAGAAAIAVETSSTRAAPVLTPI